MKHNIYDLHLTKPLIDVSHTIAQGCIKVLPFEPKRKLQKFVIGSQKNIEFWECKKGEMVNSFKSGSQSQSEQAQIMKVVVSVANEDKFSIFYSIGQNIKGITKKGKEFFQKDTTHAEAICHLHV